MNINEIATKADIIQILNAISELQGNMKVIKLEKKFLRSADVRKMLGISSGTLQRLRISNCLPAKKINGTWFYLYEDIKKIMGEIL